MPGGAIGAKPQGKRRREHFGKVALDAMITQVRESSVSSGENASPASGDVPAARAESAATSATQAASYPHKMTETVSQPGQPQANRPEMSDRGVKDLVKVFKLLSDETRLRILLYLTQCNELHVRALCERLGQSQPAVSHHLALLRVAGLIESRREGKHNYYRLFPRRLQHLLETVFDKVPGDQRQIRFEDYVLRYAPQGKLV